MVMLNTNLYFDVIIGSNSEFLELKDLIKFELVEKSGAVLPEFDLCFRTLSQTVKNRIVENNPLLVKLGTSKNDSDTFLCSISAKNVEESSNGYFTCYIQGWLFGKRFLMDKVTRVVSGTSLEGITQIAQEFFQGIDTDITSVYETPQNWIVTNDSNRNLMTDMWLHMNIQPSFPLIAVNRFGKVLLKDFNSIKQSQPKYTFTQKQILQDITEIRYLNNFYVENDTHIYNSYAGYGKVVNIVNRVTGKAEVFVNENKTNLTSSLDVETSKSGNKIFDGYSTSSNVHGNYHKAYFYNTAKLLQLSNICGFVEFKGHYIRDLNLLDLVNLETLNTEKNSTLSGRYMVDTIVYTLTPQIPFTTRVYLSRDALNNLEDNILFKDNIEHVPAKTAELLLERCKEIRRQLAQIRLYLGTDLNTNLLKFLSDLKYSLLNNFSFRLFGNTINLANLNTGSFNLDYLKQLALNSISAYGISENIFGKDIRVLTQSGILKSLHGTGSLLLENFLDKVLPEEYNDLREEVIFLIEDVLTTVDDFRKVVEENETIQNKEGTTSMLLNTNDYTHKVNNIVTTLLNNVKGLDIPIPTVALTESQQLYTEEKLTNYVADVIINNLSNLNYLKGVDLTLFKNILLGKLLLDYNTINKIKSNVADIMYVRHWGSFKDETELTDFFIRRSYKDMFKTVNCTKSIDARGGRRVFIALPSIKSDVKFFINSKEVILESTDISLRYFDEFNNDIPYTIYYSSSSSLYNSNSVILEVRST